MVVSFFKLMIHLDFTLHITPFFIHIYIPHLGLIAIKAEAYSHLEPTLKIRVPTLCFSVS